MIVTKQEIAQIVENYTECWSEGLAERLVAIIEDERFEAYQEGFGDGSEAKLDEIGS